MLQVCDSPRCSTSQRDVRTVSIKLPDRPSARFDLCDRHRAPLVQFVTDMPEHHGRGTVRQVVTVGEVLNAKKRATTRR